MKDMATSYQKSANANSSTVKTEISKKTLVSS